MQLTLHNVHYVKNSKGRPVWDLTASQVQRDDISGMIYGTNITLRLFRDGKVALTLRAKSGSADIKRGKIRVWGDVTVRSPGSELYFKSPVVIYDEKKTKVVASGPIFFKYDHMEVSGKEMEIDLSQRALEIPGPVTATLE